MTGRDQRPTAGRGLDRRQFLRWSLAAGVGLAGGGALVACGGGPGEGGSGSGGPVGGASGPVPAAPVSYAEDLAGLAAPTELSVTASGPGAVEVTWSAGSVPDGALRYRVLLDGEPVEETTDTRYALDGLTAGSPLAVSVLTVAEDASTSAPTAQVLRDAPADADTPGSAPPFLVAEPTLGGAQLRWAHPDGAATPAEYRVFRSGSQAAVAVVRGGSDAGTGAATEPDTAVLVTGLDPGEAHELRLEARDAAGTLLAEARNRVRVVPFRRDLALDYTPPTTPQAVTVTAGDGALRVSWEAATDDGSGVRGYLVLVDGRFARQVEGATAAVVGGLENGTAVAVEVLAYDAAGNPSDRSDPAQGTPVAGGAPMTAPAPRVGFTVADGRVLDPRGTELVAVGANVPGPGFLWDDEVRGRADAAVGQWRWSAVRVGCGLRDWGSVDQRSGYLYHRNDAVDALVGEYTDRGVVTVLAQHASGGAPGGTSLATARDSAPDGTGRSVEQALTDWWVAVATAYRDNPYVWFNLVNEPGEDLDVLDAQYRRMVSRIRTIAPMSTIVLDAAHFAQDIPGDARIGAGPVAAETSWVLSRAAALAADLGPGAGFGPIVPSVHLYSRWPGNFGGEGVIGDDLLTARLRDYVGRVREQGLPLLVGEIGVEPGFPVADAAITRVGLYERGTAPDGAATGVLVELGVGVLAWSVSQFSGMPLTSGQTPWYAAQRREDTAQAPAAGAGLWDYGQRLPT